MESIKNKKLTVGVGDERVLSCVLSPLSDYNEQLREVIHIKNSTSTGLELRNGVIRVIDYFCLEAMGEFAVISFEDCDDDVRLFWREES